MPKKTGTSISAAVADFLNSPEGKGSEISKISVNIISEKIFTDRHEYTVEIKSKNAHSGIRREISSFEIETSVNIVKNLLTLCGFKSFNVTNLTDNGFLTIKISAGEKDGLLIGKEGRNITALQYLLSAAVEKKLGRPSPVIIDVNGYMEKRIKILKQAARTLANESMEKKREVTTELLPSYERRIIHEEISSKFPSLKTFSVGRGQYKKVVITPLI